ncbi:MAG: hypothetical protein IJG50_03575 [Clostridia bacterium]|nr:hypothetical protein [Clostridia bacterium]
MNNMYNSAPRGSSHRDVKRTDKDADNSVKRRGDLDDYIFRFNLEKPVSER